MTGKQTRLFFFSKCHLQVQFYVTYLEFYVSYLGGISLMTCDALSTIRSDRADEYTQTDIPIVFVPFM